MSQSQYAIALIYGQNEDFEIMCILPQDVTSEQAADIFREEQRRYLAKLPEYNCAIVPSFKLLLVPVWEHKKPIGSDDLLELYDSFLED